MDFNMSKIRYNKILLSKDELMIKTIFISSMYISLPTRLYNLAIIYILHWQAARLSLINLLVISLKQIRDEV